MKKYENLPKISPEQLKTYMGTNGFLARNSITNEFIAFDGIKAGGHSFIDVEALDSYLKHGTIQYSNIEEGVATAPEDEEVSTSPVPIEEEVTVKNTEENLSS
tara:strand:+ start:1649 stop:1957 length:309 start_codon:yes stop_codon:yes gene_type:complete